MSITERADETRPPVRPGATNSLTDVDGIRVGHHTVVGDGWLTGATVVVAPPEGAAGGVDVRGGGPGTRETDLLDPRNVVEQVHAIALSGGSAYGLATADGVMARLAAAGTGLVVGPPSDEESGLARLVVPIVPGAVVFDLGRGGDGAHHPDAAFGSAAYDTAMSAQGAAEVQQGGLGAGTGAAAGHLKGGIGSASAVLDDGTTVAALLVVNPAGSPVDDRSGQLHGAPFCLPGELPDMRPPIPDEIDAFREVAAAQRRAITLNTTLAVVATDATLTKAQCAKVAGVGHDGMARAIRPAHTMLDGDTVFTLATGRRPAPQLFDYQDLLAVAADCVTRAVVHGMLAAKSVVTPAGRWPSYREAFPSAFDDREHP